MPIACDRRPSPGLGSVAVRLLPPKMNRLRTPRPAAAVPAHGHDPAAVVASHLASCYLYREKNKKKTNNKNKRERNIIQTIQALESTCVIRIKELFRAKHSISTRSGFTEKWFQANCWCKYYKVIFVSLSSCPAFFFTGNRRVIFIGCASVWPSIPLLLLLLSTLSSRSVAGAPITLCKQIDATLLRALPSKDQRMRILRIR